MDNPIMDGLAISISGLLITFLALGIFILVITILQKAFPGKEENGQEVEEAAPVDEGVVAAVESTEDENIPVVIAAALGYFRSKAQDNLGVSLAEGRGAWWAANRMNSQQGLKRSGK